jgi:hypothetical protein
MPLKPGKKNIGLNIKEMVKAGHPLKQARAASLSKAYGRKTALAPRSPVKPLGVKTPPLLSLKAKNKLNKLGKT